MTYIRQKLQFCNTIFSFKFYNDLDNLFTLHTNFIFSNKIYFIKTVFLP